MTLSSNFCDIILKQKVDMLQSNAYIPNLACGLGILKMNIPDRFGVINGEDLIRSSLPPPATISAVFKR